MDGFKLGPRLLGGREARDLGSVGIEGRTDAQRVELAVTVAADVNKKAQCREDTTDLTQAGASRIFGFSAGAGGGRSARQVETIGNDIIRAFKTQALTGDGSERVHAGNKVVDANHAAEFTTGERRIRILDAHTVFKGAGGVNGRLDPRLADAKTERRAQKVDADVDRAGAGVEHAIGDLRVGQICLRERALVDACRVDCKRSGHRRLDTLTQPYIKRIRRRVHDIIKSVMLEEQHEAAGIEALLKALIREAAEQG